MKSKMKTRSSFWNAWIIFSLRSVFLILVLSSQRLNGQNSLVDNLNVRDGEAHYASLVEQAEVPLYGLCWKSAIERLHTDCAKLTDEMQGRLALLFTNCFLEKLGMETYACEPDEEISSCTKNLDAKSFSAYTTFYPHTQNMCFFLKSNLWRRQTESTISRLVDASNVVGSSMKRNLQLQQRMMMSQEKSLESVEKLVSHGRDLNNAVEASKTSVREFLREFQENSGEQRALFAEIFQHIAKVRTLVFGEIASIYSVAYYISSLLVSYLLTSTKRGEGARFWIFAIFTVSFFAENVLVFYDIEENFLKYSTEAQDIVYHRTWILRKSVISLNALVLVAFFLIYRDLNKASYELLKELMTSNKDLKDCILRLNSSATREFVNETPKRNRTKLVEPLDETLYESGYEAEVDDQVLNPAPTMSTPKINDSVQKIVEESRKRRPGRPKSNKSDISFIVENSRPETPYNLRERRSRQSSPALSSVMGDESPHTFAMIVKHLAEESKQTSQELRKVILEKKKVYKRTLGAQLSSDDDIY